jgi:hypothetical protein
MSIIHFTHIPKTAGSSFVKSYLEPEFGPNYFRPSGYREFARTKYPASACIHGHFPFGMHYFKPLRKQEYIIFFRDPVERCRSHFYFVLQNKRHYDYERLSQTTLKDVFLNKSKLPYSALQSNLQTKFTAGVLYGFSGLFSEKTILEKAKQHLRKRYTGIGIQEQFEESCKRFEETFGWKQPIVQQRFQKTNKKAPLDDATINAIENHNQLDRELYEFVQKTYFPVVV